MTKDHEREKMSAADDMMRVAGSLVYYTYDAENDNRERERELRVCRSSHSPSA